ncbi:MAG TPA: hypothetical protein VHR67_00610 [Aestuariivirgaceae bacterium]|nr:hypothetical protein [Aestuariivirgaceae bacterium]
MFRGQVDIATAVFRKLGTLCAPAASEPLPPAMAALMARLAAATPINGEQPQQAVESP